MGGRRIEVELNMYFNLLRLVLDIMVQGKDSLPWIGNSCSPNALESNESNFLLDNEIAILYF
jgi:hypothetical protein